MRRRKPREGDPLIDFVDATLDHIEEIRYELTCMKSDLVVIRKVMINLLKERNLLNGTTSENTESDN